MTILDEILEAKAREVADAKGRPDASERAAAARDCARAPLGFRAAIQSSPDVSVIAEVKRRSPSKGLIREDFDAVAIARTYVESGATCLSVLTDERFFGGSLDDLVKVREVANIPLLRKDFVIDAVQIDEARLAGADAILLIVAALDEAQLRALKQHAETLGLDVLVEVHDEHELDRALAVDANLIGVNNRDLRTFDVDLAVTERLGGRIADALRDDRVVLIAESGIKDAADVVRLGRAGAKGFLVGESLMRVPDPGAALRALRRPM